MKMIAAFLVATLLKFNIGQFFTSPFSSAFLKRLPYILMPIGIINKPATIKPGSMIYINKPIYDPPKSKKVVSNASDRIQARLNIANTAPVMETQFLNDAGSFIVLFFSVFKLTFKALQKSK